MKKIATVLLVLIILLGGGLFYLHTNLDSIVKNAIEEYGSQAAKTDVRVGSVKIVLAAGTGAINDLSIANPRGFSSSKAIETGLASIKIQPGSVTGGGPIVIDEIVIDRTQVQFEVTESGDSNLQTLENNARGSAPAAGSTAEKNQQAEVPSRKVIINHLYIRNAQATISHPLLKEQLSAQLPTIELKDIGKDTNGASPAQVAEQVLKGITQSAKQAASAQLNKKLGGVLMKKATGSGADKVLNRMNGLLR